MGFSPSDFRIFQGVQPAAITTQAVVIALAAELQQLAQGPSPKGLILENTPGSSVGWWGLWGWVGYGGMFVLFGCACWRMFIYVHYFWAVGVLDPAFFFQSSFSVDGTGLARSIY